MDGDGELWKLSMLAGDVREMRCGDCAPLSMLAGDGRAMRCGVCELYNYRCWSNSINKMNEGIFFIVIDMKD